MQPLQIQLDRQKPRFLTVACLIMGLMMSATGCQSIQKKSLLADKLRPSNDRNWIAEQAKLPRAEIAGTTYTLRNIRNCNYLTNDDYVVQHFDRTIQLDQIQTVDFIVVPFENMPRIAHTMLSFGLDDGTYLCLSVEVRTEKGERYNPLMGLGRQFELMYVLADERDLIRVRTRHRDAEVYVYPTVAKPPQVQALFADVMKRVNKLAVDPEFYHSLKNNCTTNLAAHVNVVSPNKITYGWKVLLPGLSAEYAYELGLLDNSVSFEQLTQLALVNDLAELHYDDPDFSHKIRSRQKQLERFSELQRRFERRYQ